MVSGFLGLPPFLPQPERLLQMLLDLAGNFPEAGLLKIGVQIGLFLLFAVLFAFVDRLFSLAFQPLCDFSLCPKDLPFFLSISRRCSWMIPQSRSISSLAFI